MNQPQQPQPQPVDRELIELTIADLEANIVSAATRKALQDKNHNSQVAFMQKRLAELRAKLAE